MLNFVARLRWARAGSSADTHSSNMIMHLQWLDAIFRGFLFGYGGYQVMLGKLGFSSWRVTRSGPYY